MENIKKYIVGMDSETYAISLVEEPAIEEDFVALAKQKEQILFETNEKHMIYGAVLVPDKDIYRNNGEQEYFISFTTESIEKMSQEYMKEYRQREVTLDHEEYATEICLVETWLKSDMNCDKSVALGLNPNLPIGTWFAGMKVNNIETWERIKNGELKGFSVESMVSLEDFAKQAIKQEAESTPVVETPTATETVAEPVVEQPSPNEPPPVPAEAVVEEPVQETVVETPTEPQEQPSEPQEQPTEPNPLEDTIKSLQAEIDALKTKIADLTEENKELGKLPSADPVKPNAKPNSDAWANWRKIAKQYV
jgi:hypothetical protein